MVDLSEQLKKVTEGLTNGGVETALASEVLKRGIEASQKSCEEEGHCR